MYILAGIIIYTVISCWWFLYHLGDKDHEDTWIDYVLAPPAALIALLIGIGIKLNKRIKR